MVVSPIQLALKRGVFMNSIRFVPTAVHPLLFSRLPGAIGYTAYLAPPLSRREEEGFSSCSTRPCHRAAAITPSEWSPAPASLRSPCCLHPILAGSASEAENFRGHLCVRLRCGPVTRRHPYDDFCRWASGHRFPSSLPSKLRGSGFYLGGTVSR